MSSTTHSKPTSLADLQDRLAALAELAGSRTSPARASPKRKARARRASPTRKTRTRRASPRAALRRASPALRRQRGRAMRPPSPTAALRSTRRSRSPRSRRSPSRAAQTESIKRFMDVLKKSRAKLEALQRQQQ